MLSRASASYGQQQHDPWQELAPPPGVQAAWADHRTTRPLPGSLPYAVRRPGRSWLRKLMWGSSALLVAFGGGVYARPAVERETSQLMDRLPLGLGDVIREQASWPPRSAVPGATPMAVGGAGSQAATAAPVPSVTTLPSVTPLPASASDQRGQTGEEATQAAVKAAAPTVEPLPSAPSIAVAQPAQESASAGRRDAQPPAPVEAANARTSRSTRFSSRSVRHLTAAASFHRPEAQPTRSQRAVARAEQEAAAAAPIKLAKVDRAKVEKAEEPQEAPAPRAAAEPSDPLERLMASAVPGKKSRRDREPTTVEQVLKEQPAPSKDVAAAAVPTAAEPKHPLNRSQIVQGMKSIQGDIDECARKFNKTGAADLELSVDRDGTVQRAKTTGALAGTPVGKCLEQAAASADFPTSDGMKFPYRLTLR